MQAQDTCVEQRNNYIKEVNRESMSGKNLERQLSHSTSCDTLETVVNDVR
jgi:hypothetical protein